MDIVVKVCDVDPIVGEATGQWAVRQPNGELVKLTLCSAHAEPIALVIEQKMKTDAQSQSVKVTRRSATKKTAAPSRRRRSVTTLTEIAKSKG